MHSFVSLAVTLLTLGSFFDVPIADALPTNRDIAIPIVARDLPLPVVHLRHRSNRKRVNPCDEPEQEPEQVPEPEPEPQACKIKIVRASNQASLGWIYNSNGPAWTSNEANAATFNYQVSTEEGVNDLIIPTTPYDAANLYLGARGSSLYAGFEWVPQAAPFYRPTNPNEEVAGGIFTKDSTTSAITVHWKTQQSPALVPANLWVMGGRLYPVIDEASFLQSTGGVSASKYIVNMVWTCSDAPAAPVPAPAPPAPAPAPAPPPAPPPPSAPTK